jgi:Zn-dependent M28 family amino/carboxypeptidase
MYPEKKFEVNRLILLGILLALITMGSLSFYLFWRPSGVHEGKFNGVRALVDVKKQVEFGPRIPGSEAHAQVVSWIQDELTQANWGVETQAGTMLGHPIRNVIGRRQNGDGPWIVLGAHFDTRLYADKDPDESLRFSPVPGANDGASGVAVLLELARVFPADFKGQVWLVFFDAEDNGGIEGWDWILGSRLFVEELVDKPDAVVILDMIGDADLNVYLEQNSDLVLSSQIWSQAAALGYGERFIPVPKYRILDDHIPFLEAGIPAVDVIDFDYPFHHTSADTVDKVSAESLSVIGETILAWLLALD